MVGTRRSERTDPRTPSTMRVKRASSYADHLQANFEARGAPESVEKVKSKRKRSERENAPGITSGRS